MKNTEKSFKNQLEFLTKKSIPVLAKHLGMTKQNLYYHLDRNPLDQTFLLKLKETFGIVLKGEILVMESMKEESEGVIDLYKELIKAKDTIIKQKEEIIELQKKIATPRMDDTQEVTTKKPA